MRLQTVPIATHPDFARLAKKFEFDPKAREFPERLSNGKPSPLAGVTKRIVLKP